MDYDRSILVAILIIAFVLVGCEAQATPIANISTETPTPQPTPIPVEVFRYGAVANIASYLDELSDVPYEVLSAESAITDYDLVVAYGRYDGWQEAPQAHRVSLAINPNLAPLDNNTFRDLMPPILDIGMIVSNLNISGTQQTTAQIIPLPETSIQTSFANNGFPDGFQLIMASEALAGIDLVVADFADVAIDVRLIDVSETVIADNQAHMVLFLWSQESERQGWAAQVGEENVIDLWTIPISYIASESVGVTFNENGIPVPLD